jgi:excisionase family DNA binding protein
MAQKNTNNHQTMNKTTSGENRDAGVDRATMSIDETAVYLGISRQSAYAMTKRKELPTLRVGKRILVVRARLDAMLADGSLGRADPWAG